MEAVLYRYPGGIPWRDLPERFGDFKALHTRWSQKGVGKKGFEALANDADNEYAMMDGTMVRAPQHSAGAKKKTKTKPLAEAREG